ncbi:MAG: hypothetical protein QY323_00870 [Patescibacteria group bacterium]|nr:MAG: hypothetical protein QY323_00870 [Patescibacteria group bacterium]
MKKIVLALSALFLSLPLLAFAHQPRLIETETVEVVDPEVSKAYYAKLTGEPHLYRIQSDVPFRLYANVLIPDLPDAKKDVTAAVLKADDAERPIVILGGPDAAWKAYHEEFGDDDYLQSDEFRQDLPAGSYEVRVWSSNNDSAYVLAIGDKEEFPPGEILNALSVMPRIKETVFGKPWYSAYLTPFVLPKLAMTALAVLAVVVVAAVLIRRRKRV